MSQPVFRFAPSPNGRLHLGHAYSALLNQALARERGGRLLLRIEDIDPARSRPDLVDAIFDDLSWLGLSWEEPVRRQSRHLAEHKAAADGLLGRGLLYPCFCSRGEIRQAAEAREFALGRPWSRDPDGAPHYPGMCRTLVRSAMQARLDRGDRPAWRLDTARALATLGAAPVWTRFDRGGAEHRVQADPARWGDPVLVRRDVPTSYHLAVVVDDTLQGVTHVVRGRDLEAATDLHALLQRLLQHPSPLYCHHDLVRDAAGAKLSKSLGSAALAERRADGATAADIRRELGFRG